MRRRRPIATVRHEICARNSATLRFMSGENFPIGTPFKANGENRKWRYISPSLLVYVFKHIDEHPRTTGMIKMLFISIKYLFLMEK